MSSTACSRNNFYFSIYNGANDAVYITSKNNFVILPTAITHALNIK